MLLSTSTVEQSVLHQKQTSSFSCARFTIASEMPSFSFEHCLFSLSASLVSPRSTESYKTPYKHGKVLHDQQDRPSLKSQLLCQRPAPYHLHYPQNSHENYTVPGSFPLLEDATFFCLTFLGICRMMGITMYR